MLLERFLSLDRFLPFYGVFLIVYALYRLLSKKTMDTMPAWAGIGVLFAAGVMQALFLSSGALMVIYASTVLHDKGRFRATLSPIGILLGGVLLVQYGLEGKLTQEVLRIGAISLVPLTLGILLGGILHKRISQTLFMQICLVLLIVNGVWILVG